MESLGRLPDALAVRFSVEDLSPPSAEHEDLLVRFEQKWSCHLVLYRSDCAARGGASHLCSNAFATPLNGSMAHELKDLELTVGTLIVAYERPWRFRTASSSC